MATMRVRLVAHTWTRPLVFDEAFAQPQTVFAVVNCAAVGLSIFYSPVCFEFSTLGVRLNGTHLQGSTAQRSL